MLYLTAETNIMLALQPVDFRKQIDALAALCEQHLAQDSRSGCLFVFINRARTMIRVLSYQDNGYWLATKRLSQGHYTGWPKRQEAICPLAACAFNQMLKQMIAQPTHSV